MIPTKKQWGGWSLPSKHTALGLLVGILGLLVTIYSLILSPDDESTNSIRSVSGETYIPDVGEFEINYGVGFVSKPHLSLYNPKYGTRLLSSRYTIKEQSKSGFILLVNGISNSGELIKWEASGQMLTRP